MSAAEERGERLRPYTADEERTIRWAAGSADGRLELGRMVESLEKEADHFESFVRQARLKAEFIRSCLDASAGSIRA